MLGMATRGLRRKMGDAVRLIEMKFITDDLTFR